MLWEWSHWIYISICKSSHHWSQVAGTPYLSATCWAFSCLYSSSEKAGHDDHCCNEHGILEGENLNKRWLQWARFKTPMTCHIGMMYLGGLLGSRIPIQEITRVTAQMGLSCGCFAQKNNGRVVNMLSNAIKLSLGKVSFTSAWSGPSTKILSCHWS